jgi:hypothetical protein
MSCADFLQHDFPSIRSWPVIQVDHDFSRYPDRFVADRELFRDLQLDRPPIAVAPGLGFVYATLKPAGQRRPGHRRQVIARARYEALLICGDHSYLDIIDLPDQMHHA